VRALLAANADVNAKGNDGGTALILASQHDHLVQGGCERQTERWRHRV
jgi:ankyrin repeat protein